MISPGFLTNYFLQCIINTNERLCRQHRDTQMQYHRGGTPGDIFLKGIDKENVIVYNINISAKYVCPTQGHTNAISPRWQPRGYCFAIWVCADCQTFLCPATCKCNVKLHLLRQIQKTCQVCITQVPPPSVPDYSAFWKLTTVLLYHRKKFLSNLNGRGY